MGSTSFNFAQNEINDFQNTILNAWLHCLQQMPQKLNRKVDIFCSRVMDFKK